MMTFEAAIGAEFEIVAETGQFEAVAPTYEVEVVTLVRLGDGADIAERRLLPDTVGTVGQIPAVKSDLSGVEYIDLPAGTSSTNADDPYFTPFAGEIGTGDQFDDVLPFFGRTAAAFTGYTVTDGTVVLDMSAMAAGTAPVGYLPAPEAPTTNHALVGVFVRRVARSAAVGASLAFRLVDESTAWPFKLQSNNPSVTNGDGRWIAVGALSAVTVGLNDAADRSWGAMFFPTQILPAGLGQAGLVLSVGGATYPDTATIEVFWLWRLTVSGDDLTGTVAATKVRYTGYGVFEGRDSAGATLDHIEDLLDGDRMYTKTILGYFDPVAEGLTSGPVADEDQPMAVQGRVVPGDVILLPDMTKRVASGTDEPDVDDSLNFNKTAEYIAGPDGQWRHRNMSAETAYDPLAGRTTNYTRHGGRRYGTDGSWYLFFGTGVVGFPTNFDPGPGEWVQMSGGSGGGDGWLDGTVDTFVPATGGDSVTESGTIEAGSCNGGGAFTVTTTAAADPATLLGTVLWSTPRDDVFVVLSPGLNGTAHPDVNVNAVARTDGTGFDVFAGAGSVGASGTFGWSWNAYSTGAGGGGGGGGDGISQADADARYLNHDAYLSDLDDPNAAYHVLLGADPMRLGDRIATLLSSGEAWFAFMGDGTNGPFTIDGCQVELRYSDLRVIDLDSGCQACLDAYASSWNQVTVGTILGHQYMVYATGQWSD